MELLDNIVACRGREEPRDLESFLDGAMSGIDPALRVALTLALLAGGQATTEAETRLLREAKSKVRLTSAGRTLPETTNRATIDAEFRLQMFLGEFGYLEAYMRGRMLDGHEEAPKANANLITIGEGCPDRDGSSSRFPSVKTLRGVNSGSMKLCKKKRRLPREQTEFDEATS